MVEILFQQQLIKFIEGIQNGPAKFNMGFIENN